MSFAARLKAIPMFSALPPEALEGLARLLQPRHYAREKTIFSKDDRGDSLYIIDSGKVSIRLLSAAGKEFILHVLEQGEVFGELALLDGEPRSADAVAHEDANLLVLSRDAFLRFVGERPAVAMNLLSGLSQLVRRLTRQLQDALLLTVPARMARMLLDEAKAHGKTGPDGVVSLPPMTQEEMAKRVGVTRESVNKCLKRFVDEGLIRYDGNKGVTLLDKEGLEGILDDE